MKNRGSKSVETVAKRLMPGLSRRSRGISEQIRKGHSPALGFLHIPKTGGSGISELGRRLVEDGRPFPCTFGHDWSFEAIRKDRPTMRIALIVRDPLERAISGFNSRLRQGRPTYRKPWRPAEAAAFALFPDVTRWLDALVADDEWSLSAHAYVQQHVTHLRWNYRFYFESPAAVREQAAAIALVGRIEETDAFVDALLAEAGIPAERVAGRYQRRHEAPVRTASALEGYSAGDIAKMRARLAEEYAIYEALLELAAGRAAGGAAA
jgi:hypothetical protein